MLRKPFESGTTKEAKLHSDGPWAEAVERFDATGNAAALLETRTALVDALVCAAWREHLAPAFPRGLALAAVAGYGRRELFPCSDVDLLLLADSRDIAGSRRAALTAFLQALWDSGVRPSHSVRALAECCELHEDNIELHISLLDARMLAGDTKLYSAFEAEVPRFFHGQRQPLLRHLCRLARERHAKSHNLIYHLEPNVKETPGGLRDYQLVLWAKQLRDAAPERLPRPEPPGALCGARDFLFAARCFLHNRLRRDTNVLTFDLQEEIASHPGLCAAGPAAWMREYFRHAREIWRAGLRTMEAVEEQSSSLLVQFRDWRSRVSNAEFFVSRERVYVRTPGRLASEPGLVLRLFQFVGRHGLKLAAETERRVASSLGEIRSAFAATRLPWRDIEEIASQPHAALAFRTMQDTGVLAILFPEWERIECLVVRDFHHRYTVDEHTLVAIESLQDLRQSTGASERGFRELLAEIGSPAPLVIALLLHDLGKASRTGAHVGESVVLARGALERVGAPAAVSEMVLFLVGQHLELSSAMRSRDLGDPATARWLAERTGTIEKLRNLALLTYADITAVNPGAMTPWRMEQLWRVYVVAHNELTRELVSERIQAPAAEQPDRAAFLEGLPVRYARTHSEEEIAAHLELERRARARGVALTVAGGNSTYRLTLVARDRPFLLASLAGALAAFGMHILKAEGFSNAAGMVVDTFVFSDPHRTLELNPTEIERLRVTLERVVLGKADVTAMLRNRPSPGAPSRAARIDPKVSFDAHVSESATLIHVSAQDRPGLLYDLASAISKCGGNIDLVLIDTEAHKAIDVFYVTAAGKKPGPEQQAELEHALLAAAQPR